LLSAVWPDTFVKENNLADNIFKLRRLLGDGENGTRFIETVPKRGYRFVADVRAVESLTEQESQLASHVVAQRPRPAEEQETRVPPAATPRPVIVPWLLVGAMFLVLMALGIAISVRGTPELPRMLKAELLPPESASFGDIALSPDGKWLAFTAVTGSRVRVWVRSLADDEATPVESTDGAFAHSIDGDAGRLRRLLSTHRDSNPDWSFENKNLREQDMIGRH
jgi:hypothetical protein